MKIPAIAALLLAACQTLPENFTAAQLKLITYQDPQGNRLIPVARTAGEKRQAAWRQWLTQNRNRWNTSPYQTTPTGSTKWCAQWQEDMQEHRICKRNPDTLVWFGYGTLQDAQAIQSAERIWIGR